MKKVEKVATSIGNFLQLFEIKVVISELNTSNTLSSYSFRPILVNLVIFIILLLSATLTQFETSVRGTRASAEIKQRVLNSRLDMGTIFMNRKNTQKLIISFNQLLRNKVFWGKGPHNWSPIISQEILGTRPLESLTRPLYSYGKWKWHPYKIGSM